MLRVHDDAASFFALLLSSRGVEREPAWVGLACCPSAVRFGQMLHAAARHISAAHAPTRVVHGGFVADNVPALASWLEHQRLKVHLRPPAELVALLARLGNQASPAHALCAAMPTQPSLRRHLVQRHAAAPADHPGVPLEMLSPPSRARLPRFTPLLARLAGAAVAPHSPDAPAPCVAFNRALGIWARGLAAPPKDPSALARVTVRVTEQTDVPPFWEESVGEVEAVWLPGSPALDTLPSSPPTWFAKAVHHKSGL